LEVLHDFPEPYSISVPESNSYWVAAFMDVDGDGVGSATDPWAISSFNMVDAGANTLTLTLQDAEGNQWEELNYFGALSSSIDLMADADNDGVNNGDEFSNGTDWRNSDSDGDGLLDGADAFAANPDADGDGLGDGSENELNKSLAANPPENGVLINVPTKGFYHVAETNLTLNYLGGR
jgi:hypothetical protein